MRALLVSMAVIITAAVVGSIVLGVPLWGPSKERPADSAGAPPAGLDLPDHISPTFTWGPGWLGTYVSSPKGFRTVSYWIEGPEGLILVDTQFLLSSGQEAADLAEAATGKKVVAAFVLHANPDKFNGTAQLQQRGAKVLTSDQVRALIPAVHELRHRWFHERYKPNYPDKAPAPDSFGAETRDVQAAGLTVKAHSLGPGCSEAHVVLEYDKHVFVGDLVASGGHAWLELGRLDDWLARLDEIEALAPEHVHPGRGPSGGPELIARQRQYLRDVIGHVKAANPRPDTPPKDKEAALAAIYQRLVAEHPGYTDPYFVELGLPAVWDRLAAAP